MAGGPKLLSIKLNPRLLFGFLFNPFLIEEIPINPTNKRIKSKVNKTATTNILPRRKRTYKSRIRSALQNCKSKAQQTSRKNRVRLEAPLKHNCFKGALISLMLFNIFNFYA